MVTVAWTWDNGCRCLGLERKGHLQQSIPSHKRCARPSIYPHSSCEDATGETGLSIQAKGERKSTTTVARRKRETCKLAEVQILASLVKCTVTSVIGFTGCVGALRENTCLLATYAVFLGSLLLLEMTLGVLGFIFKDWIKTQATGGFQAFIIHYRDDPDQQNLIDWIQEDWLQCCGIEGPKDWDRNNYFNCSSSEIGSSEACGVPFSCCKREPNEITKNKQCGYNVRKPGNNSDVLIHEKGCIQACEEWIEKHVLIIATISIATLFTQILGICFAQNLRTDIFAQKAKWH
ncbi:hypothetical protein PV326_001976 [Microctonus aethiopoides]|nr:hypothetical protein PV326_001976 [Microctonus aethiopoides]